MIQQRTSPFRFRGVIFLLLGVAGINACQPGDRAPGDSPVAVALPSTATSKDFGDYVLHFNAQTTNQLTADIAADYGIVRSKNRAMLTVSIIKKQEASPGVPVSGAVWATANNLTGQLKNMTIKEIREGSGIYYIAETQVAHSETLIFSIDATPINESSRFSVRFQKQFFND
jgi:hypothetical protein